MIGLYRISASKSTEIRSHSSERHRLSDLLSGIERPLHDVETLSEIVFPGVEKTQGLFLGTSVGELHRQDEIQQEPPVPEIDV